MSLKRSRFESKAASVARGRTVCAILYSHTLSIHLDHAARVLAKFSLPSFLRVARHDLGLWEIARTASFTSKKKAVTRVAQATAPTG